MPLVVPTGFASAAFVHESVTGTAPHITTLGIQVAEGVDDWVTVANGLFTSYATHVLPHIANTLTLARVSLFVGDDGPSGSVDSDLPPTPGTRGSSSYEPIAMALIIRKVTNELGRAGRGRMFLPGALTDGDVDESGVVLGTRRTTIQASLDSWHSSMVNQLDTGITQPVLLHSSALTPPSPITRFSIAPVIGWIRGRIR